uniref:Uncharacterized protein n=1 Tax=Beta vulgaris TaxID=161934 RepID=K4Q464_BETVU|nr:hypothetical protein [Beta vulgaris]
MPSKVNNIMSRSKIIKREVSTSCIMVSTVDSSD